MSDDRPVEVPTPRPVGCFHPDRCEQCRDDQMLVRLVAELVAATRIPDADTLDAALDAKLALDRLARCSCLPSSTPR